ncbi:MAG TPA: transcription termination factor Rho [Acidimicrobiales bacterium]
MSVDATALERSALERKDREELTTIAQALGARPPSRARKAEIVQMILEITGVESASGDESRTGAERSGSAGSGTEGGSETGAEAGTEGQATAGTESAGTESAGEASSDAAGSDGVDAAAGADAPEEPPAEWESALAEESDGPTDAPVGATPASGSGDGDSSARPDHAPGAGAGAATRGGGDAASARQVPPEQRAGGARRPTDQRSGGQPAQSGQKQADHQQAQPKGEKQQGQPDQQQSGQKQATEQPDGAEPGNRRRRRRGRRNKQDDGQVEEFTGEPIAVEGLLDLRDEGYGFLRVRGSLPSRDDIYVSVKQVRQFGLRKGDHVAGASRPAMRNEKNPALLRIEKVNDRDPEPARQRRRFEDLTPLFPDQKLRLETVEDPSNMTSRIVDLIAPIGKGQRGLIVSPPKAGKTTVMKHIARSIELNNPEVKLIVLLVDERPEEVTDMRRWLRSPTSEVVASTFDRPADEHTQVSELTIERAKRIVEDGGDVCIILDGITRLARAYNLAAPPTGRIMSGGVDSGALYPPKKFFGAARNVEEGGSLTILATALIETGSRMDEVIFEEFKGTGNMELRLDRRMAERRIYPAIDVEASSTRHEELLFPRGQLQLVWALRRVLSGLSSGDRGNAAALELLIDRMKTFRTNEEFLAEVAKAGA